MHGGHAEAIVRQASGGLRAARRQSPTSRQGALGRGALAVRSTADAEVRISEGLVLQPNQSRRSKRTCQAFLAVLEAMTGRFPEAAPLIRERAAPRGIWNHSGGSVRCG